MFASWLSSLFLACTLAASLLWCTPAWAQKAGSSMQGQKESSGVTNCRLPFPSTQCYTITQAADDGTEENDATWHENGYAEGLDYFGKTADNTTYTLGLHFDLFDLNPGETITYARLRFSSQGGEVTSSANLKITGEDADNSPALSDSRRPSQITKTAAEVEWDISRTWVARSTWGHTPLNYYSPNVAGIVNEIVAIPDWGTGPDGKHIVLCVEDDNSAPLKANYLKCDDLIATPSGHEDPVVLEIYSALADAFIGKEFLGRPTDTSVTINLIHLLNIDVYSEYGTEPSDAGCYRYSTTPLLNREAEEPIEIVVDGLQQSTRYYYRIRYRQAGSGTYLAGEERSFHTQRPPGSSFTFTVQSDSHLLQAIHQQDTDELNLYDQTLNHIASDDPEFHISLGDFAFPESYACGHALTQDDAIERYLYQRQRLDRIMHSIPFYLVLGNHEGEQGWRYLNPDDSIAEWGTKARLKVIPNPAPDAFYSGDQNVTECCGLREDYCAWEWGDALCIALDPFWYTTTQPYSRDPEVGSEDAWDWTLGENQYEWLYDVLHNSNATWKFVFCHHLTGGVYSGIIKTPYGHGGIEAAKHKVDSLGSYEWGGENESGVDRFAERRPGWSHGSIHDMMVDEEVDVFFHGHDHVFVCQELDNVVYQEVPKPSDADYSNGVYAAGQYKYGTACNNSGYLRVKVSPDSIRVDYVRSVLPEDEPLSENGTSVYDGDVSYSYTIHTAGAGNEIVFLRHPHLFGTHPNPFRSITNVRFYLPEREHITIAVYDLQGRLLCKILDGILCAGTHRVSWDGTSDDTEMVVPGIYFCRLETPGRHSETRKMVLLQ
ncbi:MAG: T9SS type A sorting domain-containing protein [Candidatus Eisenbacteria bacterium]